MPTIVNITVGPTGRDFTTVTAALASVNSNLITADEQVNIIIDEQAGGYPEFITVPTITQSATQYLHIQAAPGDEYIPHTDTGVYFFAFRGFSAVITNDQNFTRISGVGAKNTRTLSSSRGIDNFGDNCYLTDVYATTAATATSAVYFLNNATNLVLSNALSVGGSTGFDFGNNFARTVDKITSVDATSVGIDTGTAVTTITNSLSIGSPDPYLGTFAAGSSNNAGDSTDTPGTSPQDNRTTADLVDYAGGDYRTASGSALATAGVGGTFIGYALEAGGGGGLTVDNILSNQVITQPILSTGSQLTTDNITNSQLLSNAGLSQGYMLTTDGLLSQQSLSEPLLTQANTLSVEGLSSNQSLTNVALAVAGGLSVQSILNNQNLSEPELTQQNQLTVNGLINNQTLSASELIQGFLLGVDDISSNQELTSPLLDVDGSLSVQSLVSYQTISEPTITQHIALITNNLTQDQFIGNVRLNEEDQTIGTVTAAFKESDINVKYGIASFTIKFKD